MPPANDIGSFPVNHSAISKKQYLTQQRYSLLRTVIGLICRQCNNGQPLEGRKPMRSQRFRPRAAIFQGMVHIEQVFQHPWWDLLEFLDRETTRTPSRKTADTLPNMLSSTKLRTNKQTSKQANKRTNNQANKQTNKQTNTHTHTHMDGERHTHMQTCGLIIIGTYLPAGHCMRSNDVKDDDGDDDYIEKEMKMLVP